MSLLPNVSFSIRCPAIVEVEVLKRLDAFRALKVVLEVDNKILNADEYDDMLIEAWMDELFKFVWLFNMNK